MDVKQQQVRYHDWEAPHYERKWGIGFDRRCVDYVTGRFLRAVPDGRGGDRVLEVGCGTGFFLLNLAQAGFVGEAHATDISAGMVSRCVANGRALDTRVRGTVSDVERLPYADASFDLVVGHAVLHHVPDLVTAMAEMRRVLVPGGRLVIAGEPSQVGDRIANRVKQLSRVAVKLAAVAAGGDRVLIDHLEHVAAHEREAASLEHVVDLHVFAPSQLEALARGAGFVDVRVETEELAANWFGWFTRTVESMVRPGVLPAGYPSLAYRTWKALFAVDERARRLLPRDVFYNCVLAAAAPR